MKKTGSFLAFLILSSCSHTGRKIASEDCSPPPLDDLLKASEVILTDVGSADFSEACVPYLSKLERNIDAFNITQIPKSFFLNHGEELAENSWNIRKRLHSRLSEVDENCAKQIQANFRQFRFIEDYSLELAVQVKHLTPSEIGDFQKQPTPIKEARDFYVFRSSNEKEVEFRPGDMFITRGVSFLSGMIARLGKRTTQFSHVVWVSKGEKQGEFKTIESYVGKGVDLYDFDFALRNENARILWLRAKDQDVAKKADALISSEVKRRHIKYDYNLNFDDPSTMSCAEVSQVAYQMASDGEFKIPYYPNVIEGADSLISRLKIAKGATYEPGDMEIDPRFELMGEFQDVRLTRDSRQKDAIMSAVFQWMDQYGYELKDSMKSKLAGGFIYNVRHTFLWPLFKLAGMEDFSKEIPRNMISTVTLINQLGAVLQEELSKRDKEFEKAHGMPMTIMDFYKTLEEMRQKDLALYKNKKTRKKAKFHKWFRPKKV